MKHKKRESFSSLPSMINDLIEGSNEYVKMVLFWGTACNSMQAQIKVLLKQRHDEGYSKELLEVSNEDMDQMRQYLVAGVPVYFSHYPDGVTKLYPVPEQK